MRCKFFHFTASSEQITVIFKCTATDCTARDQKFSFQRNHTNAIMEFSGNFHCIINMIDNNNSSQHSLCNITIFCISMNQFICHADHTFFFQYFRCLKLLRILNAVQRQKGSTSRFGSLEISDHFLGSIFIICNNILNITAQGYLNCCFIFRLRLNNICNNTDNTFFVLLALHYFLYASAITFIAFRQIYNCLEFGLLLMKKILCFTKFCILIRQNGFHVRKTLFHLILLIVQLTDYLIDFLKFFF